MNEKWQIELEEHIQDLLAGSLSQSETPELLDHVAHDDEARQVLADVLAMQRSARASAGCDVGEDVIEGCLKKTLRAVKAVAVIDDGRHRKPSRPHSRLMGSVGWLVGMAASVAMVVSIYVATLARQDSRLLRQQLAGAVESRQLEIAAPSAEEIGRMRQVWQQVSEGSGETRPWVLLSDGGGEFGYVPAAMGTSADGMVLLRCVVVSSDGREQTQMNMLLPVRQPVNLTVPQACSLSGQPVTLTISAADDSAGVDINVGNGPAGVAGRVQVGKAAEIGQFDLNGKTMRVFLQAKWLTGSAV